MNSLKVQQVLELVSSVVDGLAICHVRTRRMVCQLPLSTANYQPYLIELHPPAYQTARFAL